MNLELESAEIGCSKASQASLILQSSSVLEQHHIRSSFRLRIEPYQQRLAAHISKTESVLNHHSRCLHNLPISLAH